MLVLHPKTQNRLQVFLDSHDQHNVKITILSKEEMIEGRPIRINLGCHNGDCWMGFRAAGSDIDEGLNYLLDQWDMHGLSGK